VDFATLDEETEEEQVGGGPPQQINKPVKK